MSYSITHITDRVLPLYDYKTADFDRVWLLTASPLLFSTIMTLTGIFYYVYLGTLLDKVEDVVLYTNYAFNIFNMIYLMSFIITILVGKWYFLFLSTLSHLFGIYTQILLAYLLYLSILPFTYEYNIARIIFGCWVTFTTLISGRVLMIIIALLVAMGEGGSRWDLREPKSDRVLRHEKLAQEAIKNKGEDSISLLLNCCNEVDNADSNADSIYELV